MDFAEDIALGDFSSDDLDNQDERFEVGRQKDKSIFGLPLSIAISAILHLALAASLLYFVGAGKGVLEEGDLGTIRVEFVPFNPLQVVAEEVLATAAPEEADSDPREEAQTSFSAEQDSQLATDPVEEIQPDTVELAEQTTSESTAMQQEAVTLPTSESVLQVLNSQRNSATSRFYNYDCNKLEREKAFNGCAPSADRDYSSLTRNPVYDYHNPVIEVSRSRDSFATIARQSGRIAEQLALSNLSAGISSYLLEELEQGIETYSNDSSRAINHMNTLVDKSAAGEMARRIFTPWVQQQAALLRGRRIENSTDNQFRERCRSYEKYIMNPAQFARCISMGESPLGFAIEF